ncbi:hypothetical protein JCM10213_007868 [Rhodosporidiobolus nylandii]
MTVNFMGGARNNHRRTSRRSQADVTGTPKYRSAAHQAASARIAGFKHLAAPTASRAKERSEREAPVFAFSFAPKATKGPEMVQQEPDKRCEADEQRQWSLEREERSQLDGFDLQEARRALLATPNWTDLPPRSTSLTNKRRSLHHPSILKPSLSSLTIRRRPRSPDPVEPLPPRRSSLPSGTRWSRTRSSTPSLAGTPAKLDEPVQPQELDPHTGLDEQKLLAAQSATQKPSSKEREHSSSADEGQVPKKRRRLEAEATGVDCPNEARRAEKAELAQQVEAGVKVDESAELAPFAAPLPTLLADAAKVDLLSLSTSPAQPPISAASAKPSSSVGGFPNPYLAALAETTEPPFPSLRAPPPSRQQHENNDVHTPPSNLVNGLASASPEPASPAELVFVSERMGLGCTSISNEAALELVLRELSLRRAGAERGLSELEWAEDEPFEPAQNEFAEEEEEEEVITLHRPARSTLSAIAELPSSNPANHSSFDLASSGEAAPAFARASKKEMAPSSSLDVDPFSHDSASPFPSLSQDPLASPPQQRGEGKVDTVRVGLSAASDALWRELFGDE